MHKRAKGLQVHQFFRAANYAKNQLAQWGCLMPCWIRCGEILQSWELENHKISMTAPWYKSLEAYPKAWNLRNYWFAKSSGEVLITAKIQT